MTSLRSHPSSIPESVGTADTPLPRIKPTFVQGVALRVPLDGGNRVSGTRSAAARVDFMPPSLRGLAPRAQALPLVKCCRCDLVAPTSFNDLVGKREERRGDREAKCPGRRIGVRQRGFPGPGNTGRMRAGSVAAGAVGREGMKGHP